jgi:hypothetical protein
VPASLYQAAAVLPFARRLPVLMTRLPPDPQDRTDSGWQLEPLRAPPDPDERPMDEDPPPRPTLVSLYEVALVVPEVLPFLTLPPGSQLIFDGPGADAPRIKLGEVVLDRGGVEDALERVARELLTDRARGHGR